MQGGVARHGPPPPQRTTKEGDTQKIARLAPIATLTTLAIAVLLMGLRPAPAQAVTGWDWWDAVDGQHTFVPACPENPPTKSQWETALGSADDPHWTELTVFFIAYPCSNPPATFIEFRDWLNYEIHDVGTYDSGWEGYKFFDLKDLIYELDESPAGFWDDGPWD